MFRPNHLHLLVKGYLKSPPRTEKILNIFFTQLVNTVGMKVVAGPTSVYVNEPGNEGITGTVTLATSHGSIHVWDAQRPAMFQFDLYSCSEFTPSQVLKELDYWFGLDSANWVMIDRNGSKFFELSHGEWKGRGAGEKVVVKEGKFFDSASNASHNKTYKSDNICPKCYSVLNGDGMCSKCLTEING